MCIRDRYIRADGPQKRGGFGLKGYNVTEKTGPVVGVKVVSDEDDVLVINDAGVIIRMAAAGISTYGRTAQAVSYTHLDVYKRQTRRRFLDGCICQLRPKYAEALAEYRRLYEHKVRILRDWEEHQMCIRDRFCPHFHGVL